MSLAGSTESDLKKQYKSHTSGYHYTRCTSILFLFVFIRL